MALSTTMDIKDKKAKIAQLREKHQDLFDQIGMPDARFIPKLPYFANGSTEKVIAFFPSEINKGDDVFIEFASLTYDPIDPERNLYKWVYNPEFETEYQKVPSEGDKDPRYYIPIDELVLVKPKTKPAATATVSVNFGLPNADEDLPMDQMTMADFAAILLKQPVSKKPWLNELIKKAQ